MATKTPAAEQAAPEVKAPKKLGKFVVMQRIDRLLNSLPERERAGVLAWLRAEYFSEPVPQVTSDNGCHHPGFGG